MGFLIKIVVLFAVANWLWKVLSGNSGKRGREDRRTYARRSVPDVMWRCLGRMLAIIAKADGHISEREVDVASRCLRSLNLTEAEYQMCAAAFNAVHSASPSMVRQCASEFADVATDEACLLLYELLWRVAAADGRLSEGEDTLLRVAASPLGVDESYYNYFKLRYFGAWTHGRERSGASSGAGRGPERRERSDLEMAYARLGCSPSDSDDKIKSAYRRLAMRYHPDRLRAEGVPDSMIAEATKSMAEINDAWETVKRSRR